MQPETLRQSTLVVSQEKSKDEQAGGAENSTKSIRHNADYVKITLSKPEFILVFISLAMSIFLVSIENSITSTAIPEIVQEFHALNQISWVGIAYLLTSTAFSPIYGSLADILGRKLTFIIAISLFEAGSLVCGLAPSMTILLVGRLISGAGTAGILVSVLVIISDIVSFRDRGQYEGAINGILGISSIIGPLIGGGLTDAISWRWCFFFNLPFGAITIFVVTYFLKFPAPEGSVCEKLKKFDFLGTLLVAGATTCFILPLQYGGFQWPWLSPIVIGLFCSSAVFTALLVWTELYVASNPIIPAKLFENRSIPLLLVIASCLGAVFFSVRYYAPTYFQLIQDYSATKSGLDSMFLILGMVILSVGTGVAISKTGHYKPCFTIGPLIIMTGQALLSTMRADTSRLESIFYLLITGIGYGTVSSCRILGIQASVSGENIAVATATSNFMMNLGGTLGIAIGGTVFTNKLKSILSPENAQIVSENPKGIRKLANSEEIIDAVAVSLGFVYYFMIPIAALILICGLFIFEFRPEDRKDKKFDATAVVEDAI